MNVQEIRKFAKNRGVKLGKLSKQDMVKQIQREEGNFDCFATAYDNECDQNTCLWREDCFSIAVKRRQ